MTKVKYKTIEEYISSFPAKEQRILRRISTIITKAVPEATGTISYGIPAYKLNKKAVYFAGYKDYVGMYPMYGVEKIESEIAQYRAKGTKDTIHFLYKDSLPVHLISKIAQLKLK
jgi:uncharacterized protein YdhG (YjbR/CyaY superfamily)